MISVIVPVYKTEMYLNKCIDSILQQTYRDFELILVDDGSPDNSGSICDQFAMQDSRIHVIHKENGGLSDARNIGIEHAKGEYITFVDSDDWVAPELLETLLSGIQLGAQISVCGFYTVRNGKAKPWRNTSDQFVLMTALEATKDMLYTKTMDTSVWAKLFHRSCFTDIRFPVRKYYEEVATTYRVFLAQETVAVTTRQLYYYVKHRDSIVTSEYEPYHMDMLTFSKDILEYAEKNEQELILCAKRRILYSCFFLLKNMGFGYRKNKEDVNTIMASFHQYRREVFRDPEVPKRDKAAIVLLSFGPGVFTFVWSIYSCFTSRHGNM